MNTILLLKIRDLIWKKKFILVSVYFYLFYVKNGTDSYFKVLKFTVNSKNKKSSIIYLTKKNCLANICLVFCGTVLPPSSPLTEMINLRLQDNLLQKNQMYKTLERKLFIRLIFLFSITSSLKFFFNVSFEYYTI